MQTDICICAFILTVSPEVVQTSAVSVDEDSSVSAGLHIRSQCLVPHKVSDLDLQTTGGLVWKYFPNEERESQIHFNIKKMNMSRTHTSTEVSFGDHN